MNKKIILIILMLSISLSLSACSNIKDVELQKQKELDIIKAQQEKEIAVEKEKEMQRQKIEKEKEDKLNSCFDIAREKRKKSMTVYLNTFCSSGGNIIEINSSNVELFVKDCLNRIPPASVISLSDTLKNVELKEESDRAECLKIYPQN